MTRSTEGKEQRQQAILDAAVRAFSRRGYHNCTVAQVAREAGVADGTLYLYFQGKEDLLVSAFRHVLGRMLERLDRDISGVRDPLAKLRRLVELHLGLLEEDPDVASFLQFQLRQPEAAIRTAIAGPLAEYARRIEAVIEEGKAAGAFRADLGPGRCAAWSSARWTRPFRRGCSRPGAAPSRPRPGRWSTPCSAASPRPAGPAPSPSPPSRGLPPAGKGE